MDEMTTNIPVELSNGSVIWVETSNVSGEERVSGGVPSKFEDIIKSVEGIAQEMDRLIQKVQPKEATVEFGIELGFEAGKLTTYLVKGSGKANAKITLKW